MKIWLFSWKRHHIMYNTVSKSEVHSYGLLVTHKPSHDLPVKRVDFILTLELPINVWNFYWFGISHGLAVTCELHMKFPKLCELHQKFTKLQNFQSIQNLVRNSIKSRRQKELPMTKDFHTSFSSTHNHFLNFSHTYELYRNFQYTHKLQLLYCDFTVLH